MSLIGEPVWLWIGHVPLSVTSQAHAVMSRPWSRACMRGTVTAPVRLSPDRQAAAAGRLEGHFTRVYRLCRRKRLKVPQKERKRHRLGDSRNGCHRLRPEQKDHVWCWDFVFDRTASGSSLKWFSIVDEFPLECLALKVDRSIRSEDVIDTLGELFSSRGVPQCIRSDNGPEFISKAIQCWLGQLEINSLYFEPRAPWENGYAENFNSRFRDEYLAVEESESLLTARRLTVAWWEDYNGQRAHSSLGYVTPAEFASRCAVSSLSQNRTCGPTPALQADYLKTTRVASWPPWGETRTSGFADLPVVQQTRRFHTLCEYRSLHYTSSDHGFSSPISRLALGKCRDVTSDESDDEDVSFGELRSPATDGGCGRRNPKTNLHQYINEISRSNR